MTEQWFVTKHEIVSYANTRRMYEEWEGVLGMIAVLRRLKRTENEGGVGERRLQFKCVMIE